jgi:hypothetical protein
MVPHEVFISYPSKDQSVADAVCASLEKRGISCWIAPRNILGGEKWLPAIVKALYTSRVMVIVVSASTFTSKYVEQEIEIAFDRGIPIVPFRIEPVESNEGMWPILKSIHWVDGISEPRDEHLIHLAQTVAALLNAPPSPELARVQPKPPVAEPEPAPEPVPPVVPPAPRPVPPVAPVPADGPLFLPNHQLNPARFVPALFSALSVGLLADTSISGWDQVRSFNLFVTLLKIEGGLLQRILKTMGSDPLILGHTCLTVMNQTQKSAPGVRLELKSDCFSEHTLALMHTADALARAQGCQGQGQIGLIDQTHLLEGILTEESGIVANILNVLDLDGRQILKMVHGEAYRPLRIPLEQVIDLAAQEALTTGWDRIETPHLFAALASLPFSCTRRALWEQSVSPNDFIDLFRSSMFQLALQARLTSPNTALPSKDEIAGRLGERPASILHKAQQESAQRGDPKVDDRHILIAFLKQDGGSTLASLKALNIDIAKMLNYVQK